MPSLAHGQAAVICGETGASPWMNASYVFGRVKVIDDDRSKKFPRVTITLSDRQRSEHRYTIDRSGSYCFRGVDGSGGSIIIEIEGTEVARRSLSSAGPRQFQEDFEISTLQQQGNVRTPTLVVNAYPRNEKTAELFKNAVASEKDKKYGAAIRLLNEIVSIDPGDFIAWSKLGAIHFDQNDMARAETAFTGAIKAKPDFAPSMINLGRIYLIQDKMAPAIEVLLTATRSNPTNARAFQLLGEAYVLTRNGAKAFDSLKEAIRLDPIGMAECHLFLARLYDAGGAKILAAEEYKLFLEKIPDHVERKKFEKFIKDNAAPADRP